MTPYLYPQKKYAAFSRGLLSTVVLGFVVNALPARAAEQIKVEAQSIDDLFGSSLPPPKNSAPKTSPPVPAGMTPEQQAGSTNAAHLPPRIDDAPLP